MRLLPLFAVALGFALVCDRPAAASVSADPGAAKVVVVDSPLAEGWLEQAGVAFSRRSGPSLGAGPITGAKLLVLPMQSVTTPAAVANIQEYLAGGGKLVAFYWGTVTRDGVAANPAYQLCNELGVRPIAWSDVLPGKLSLANGGAGALPYGGSTLSLPSTPTVILEPLPGTLPVGRWVGPEAADLPFGYVGAVYLRGGVIYLAPNFLRAGNDRPESKDLLFWAMQRVAPELGSAIQARDRIAAAAAAVAALGPLMAGDTPPEATAGSMAAQAALTEARTFLAKGVPARSIAAADRARRLAGELAERLRRTRTEGMNNSY
jgi:hypothetical protein